MAPGLEHSQKMSRCGLGGALEKMGKEGEWGTQASSQDFSGTSLTLLTT